MAGNILIMQYIYTVIIMDWFSQVAAAQTVDAVTSNELQCSSRKTKWVYWSIGNSKQDEHYVLCFQDQLNLRNGQ